MQQSLPPLTQVQAALNGASLQRLAPLDNVVDLISTFLDASRVIPLERAAASGSVRLFERVAVPFEASTTVGTIDRAYAFSLALEAAIRADDLVMVQAVHTLHPARLQLNSLQLAFAHGSLPLVQWTIENRNDRLCCASGIENLCHGCLRYAAQTIGPNDPYGVSTWLITKGLVSIRADPAVAAVGVSPSVWSALRQSALLVRWCETQGLLTEAMIQHLVDEVLQRANAASAEIVAYFLERGYTPGNLHAFVAKVIAASCQNTQELLVETVLDSAVFAPVRHHFVYEATLAGGDKVLQWSRAYEAEHNRTNPFLISTTVSVAGSYGHLDTMKWLADERGASFRLSRFDIPENKVLKILQWLDQTNVAASLQIIINSAASQGQLNVIQWLHERGNGKFTSANMDWAAYYGHLDVVQWLHANRSEGCSRDALNNAAANGHLDVAQWLYAHRHEGDVHEAMMHAAARGHLRVVQWCIDHGGCVQCVQQYLLGNPMVANTCSDTVRPQVLYTLQWIDQELRDRALGSACTRACIDVYAGHLTLSLAEAAVVVGDMQLLEYLHLNHAYVFSRMNRDNGYVFGILTWHGHIAPLQWLYGRYPTSLDWQQLALRADEQHHAALAAWLHSVAV